MQGEILKFTYIVDDRPENRNILKNSASEYLMKFEAT